MTLNLSIFNFGKPPGAEHGMAMSVIAFETAHDTPLRCFEQACFGNLRGWKK